MRLSAPECIALPLAWVAYDDLGLASEERLASLLTSTPFSPRLPYRLASLLALQLSSRQRMLSEGSPNKGHGMRRGAQDGAREELQALAEQLSVGLVRRMGEQLAPGLVLRHIFETHEAS